MTLGLSNTRCIFSCEDIRYRTIVPAHFVEQLALFYGGKYAPEIEIYVLSRGCGIQISHGSMQKLFPSFSTWTAIPERRFQESSQEPACRK